MAIKTTTSVQLASHSITSPAAQRFPTSAQAACPLVKRSSAQCMQQRGRPSTVSSSIVCAAQLQAKRCWALTLASHGLSNISGKTSTIVGAGHVYNNNNNNHHHHNSGTSTSTTSKIPQKKVEGHVYDNNTNHELPLDPSRVPPHELPHGLDPSRVPPHVAIIVDGNSRWADAMGLMRSEGHTLGMKTLMDLIWLSSDWGLSAFTAFLFSTENWNRSEAEVSSLMEIFENNFVEHLKNFSKYNIKVKIIGDTKRLPMSLQNIFLEMENRTSTNSGLKLAFALNYGGHLDIMQAFQRVAKKIEKGKINIEDISDQVIEKELWTNWMGDAQNVDLLIRTGGDKRISNFLLWQAAYAEIMFIDTFWPAFNHLLYAKCLMSYQNCDRRFGRRQ